MVGFYRTCLVWTRVHQTILHGSELFYGCQVCEIQLSIFLGKTEGKVLYVRKGQLHSVYKQDNHILVYCVCHMFAYFDLQYMKHVYMCK